MALQDVKSRLNVNDVLDALDNLQQQHIELLNDMRGHVSNYELLQPDQKTDLFLESPESSKKSKPMILEEINQKYLIQKGSLCEPTKSDIIVQTTKDKSNKPGEKVRKTISTVLFYGLLLCLIGSAFLISQGRKRSVFGYFFMNVLTWSMQSEIPQGSMVVIKQVEPDTIKIGDDITYMMDADTAVTHRVIGITENYENSGGRGFETQGIENDVPDFEIVPSVNVVGVVQFHIPKLGNWLEWLRENLIITIGFITGFVLLIILIKGALKKDPEENKKHQSKSRKLKSAS